MEKYAMFFVTLVMSACILAVPFCFLIASWTSDLQWVAYALIAAAASAGLMWGRWNHKF